MPRSPTPVALEERPRESLTREELLELLERREAAGSQARSELRQRVKRERAEAGSADAENDDSDGLEVVDPPKRPRVVETVDLTGD